MALSLWHETRFHPSRALDAQDTRRLAAAAPAAPPRERPGTCGPSPQHDSAVVDGEGRDRARSGAGAAALDTPLECVPLGPDGALTADLHLKLHLRSGCALRTADRERESQHGHDDPRPREHPLNGLAAPSPGQRREGLGRFGEIVPFGIGGPEPGEILASDGEPDVVWAENARVFVVHGIVLPLADGANLVRSSRTARQYQSLAAGAWIEHSARVPDGPLRRERDRPRSIERLTESREHRFAGRPSTATDHLARLTDEVEEAGRKVSCGDRSDLTPVCTYEVASAVYVPRRLAARYPSEIPSSAPASPPPAIAPSSTGSSSADRDL